MAVVITGAKKDIKLDYTNFSRNLAIYGMVMKKKAVEVIKQQARYFAMDMCDFTPPFAGSSPAAGGGGFNTAAKKKGMDAVNRDIRRIFAPLDQAPAAVVAKTGNIGVLSAWMNAKLKLPEPHMPEYIFKMYQERGIIGQSEFDYFQRIESNHLAQPATILLGATEAQVESAHIAERGSPEYRLNKNLRNGRFYVDNFGVVKAYIKRVQVRVGKLKSGWYSAGLKLGKMKNANWISRQGASTSVYVARLTGDDPTIKLGSTNGRNISQGYHFMQMALKHRDYSLRNAIFYHLNNPKNKGKLEEVARRIGMEQFDLTQTQE